MIKLVKNDTFLINLLIEMAKTKILEVYLALSNNSSLLLPITYKYKIEIKTVSR